MAWIHSLRLISRNKTPWLSRTSAFLQFRGIDTQLRYERIAKEIERTDSDRVLDIGSGGHSPLTSLGIHATSLDLHANKGVNVVADARWLPFKNLSFDCVVAIDCVEHIPKENRTQALSEMIRIAKRKVVIHTPVHDGKLFLAGVYDEHFLYFHRKIFNRDMLWTIEHLRAKHPSPNDFTSLGFTISGVNNVHVWLFYMTLYYVPLVKIFGWPLYLLFLKYFDTKPPYWGIVAVLAKLP